MGLGCTDTHYVSLGGVAQTHTMLWGGVAQTHYVSWGWVAQTHIMLVFFCFFLWGSFFFFSVKNT